jgi:hypothetical protein
MRARTSVEMAVSKAVKSSLEACYAALKTRVHRMALVENGGEVPEGPRVESENITMDEAALTKFAVCLPFLPLSFLGTGVKLILCDLLLLNLFPRHKLVTKCPKSR